MPIFSVEFTRSSGNITVEAENESEIKKALNKIIEDGRVEDDDWVGYNDEWNFTCYELNTESSKYVLQGDTIRHKSDVEAERTKHGPQRKS